MKILFLVQRHEQILPNRLYDSIARHVDQCETRWLSDAEQANLKAYFSDIDTTKYDRILCFLRFKKELKQARFIRTIPNLVILEHDAFQNYIPCKYTGKFSQHYRKMPWLRIINSGFGVTRRLVAEGFDAVFVAKGYDQVLLSDMQQPRDIELGFVGSLKSSIYDQRRAFLNRLAQQENLTITRTAGGEAYWHMLNRIRFFISADVGMGEFMIKNFEAMACGCVLFSYNHGDDENTALGFVDMKNIVLYKDMKELTEKLAHLRAHPELADHIARTGREFVTIHYSYELVGKRIAAQLDAPLRQPDIRSFLGFNYHYGWK